MPSDRLRTASPEELETASKWLLKNEPIDETAREEIADLLMRSRQRILDQILSIKFLNEAMGESWT